MLALSALQFQNGSSKTELKTSYLWNVPVSYLLAVPVKYPWSVVNLNIYLLCSGACVVDCTCVMVDWPSSRTCKLNLWMWMSTYLWILPVNEHMPVNLNIYLLCSGACVVDCTCVMVDWPSSRTCELNLWMWLNAYLWILPDNKHMPVNWIIYLLFGSPSELPVKSGSLNLWICHSLNN